MTGFTSSSHGFWAMLVLRFWWCCQIFHLAWRLWRKSQKTCFSSLCSAAPVLCHLWSQETFATCPGALTAPLAYSINWHDTAIPKRWISPVLTPHKKEGSFGRLATLCAWFLTNIDFHVCVQGGKRFSNVDRTPSVSLGIPIANMRRLHFPLQGIAQLWHAQHPTTELEWKPLQRT